MDGEAQDPRDWRREVRASEDPPDRAAAREADALAALDGYSCASCGGDLAYAPSLGALLCEHCGSETPIPEPSAAERRSALAERDLTAAFRAAASDARLAVARIVTCGSCGAEEVFDPGDRARPCPFCGAPLVAEPEERRRVEPRALLPFLIDEADAKARLRAWLGRLWFAPSSLGALARADRPLSGVYAPYFTFDAATRSTYQGSRGDAYTDHVWRSVRVNGRWARKRVPVRKIRWSPASGRVARRFDDLAVSASVGLERRLLDQLDRRGWDFSALQPYQPQYLAGFVAENPAVPLDQSFQRARAVMDRVIERDVRRDIGGDAQRIRRVSTDVSEMTYRSTLAPVWVANYRHRGRVYQALVNGRTGAVVGDRPYALWKIALALLGVAALLGLVYLGIDALGIDAAR